jgi:hypothetical protein
MKAEERTISGILNEQICYRVPAYQRPYSWKRENVQQLLEDVWEAFEERSEEYFMGSLITIEIEKDTTYDVVDGQQRLTTLNLIFARLRDHIIDAPAKASLSNRILPRDELTGQTETPRLLLRRKDQQFFRRHVLDSEILKQQEKQALSSPQIRIAENLDAIDAFLLNKDQTTLKLLANYLLKKVYVVFVRADSLKSAYRLFNVLNARGLSLSNADLIKNTLFEKLGLDGNRAEELEERWLSLEEHIGIDRLDAFFSHYRTSLTATKSRKSIHEELEPEITKNPGGSLAFLDSAIVSAQHFARITKADFVDGTSMRALRALNRVEYDEWIAPLLAFLQKPTPDLLESEFLVLMEKITMQNWVRRLGRTARLTVYFQLINAIAGNKTADEVRTVFRANSNNEEFVDLLNSDVYDKPFDAAVLLRLDESVQDESVTRVYSGQLTIEHVLPRSLKEQYWKERFTEQQHGLWLHRLGNLAMLSGSKNYRAQNFSFDRKKSVYLDPARKVSFDLTKEVCLNEEWTEAIIQARQSKMIDLAKSIWLI